MNILKRLMSLLKASEPTVVVISFTTVGQYGDVVDWLRSNIIGWSGQPRWGFHLSHTGIVTTGQGFVVNAAFAFKDKADAMLFRLTWGGDILNNPYDKDV